MEENKVREKLRELIAVALHDMTQIPEHPSESITDRILQSPDLRVELVEPRYTVTEWPTHSDVKTQVILENGNYYGETNSRKHSQEIADWLNSKEPK
jgi:hypothetical protein